MLAVQACIILAVGRVVALPPSWHKVGRPLDIPASAEMDGLGPFCIDDTGRFFYGSTRRWDLRSGKSRGFNVYTGFNPTGTTGYRDWWACWDQDAPPLNPTDTPYHGRIEWRAWSLSGWRYCHGDTLGLYFDKSDLGYSPEAYWAGRIGDPIQPRQGSLPTWVLSRITRLVPGRGAPNNKPHDKGYTIVGPGRHVWVREPSSTVSDPNFSDVKLIGVTLVPGGTYWKENWAYIAQSDSPASRGIYRLEFGGKRDRMSKVDAMPHRPEAYFAFSDGSLVKSAPSGRITPSLRTTRIYNPYDKTWKSYPGVWVRASSLNGRYVAFSLAPWTKIRVAEVR